MADAVMDMADSQNEHKVHATNIEGSTRGTELEGFGTWLNRRKGQGRVWSAFDHDGDGAFAMDELKQAVDGYLSQASAEDKASITQFLENYNEWRSIRRR